MANHLHLYLSSSSPSKTHLAFSLIILCLLSPIAISNPNPNPNPTPSNPTAVKPSAYEVLQSYNFPVGILPEGITGYDLDESTGKFAAYMNGTCGFSLEGSYQLEYKSAIKGYISKGKLSSLEGVKVKIFLLWVGIVEVTRSTDGLEFSVGIASAGFPLDNFYQSPRCGCGLNCDGVAGNEGRSRSSESLLQSY